MATATLPQELDTASRRRSRSEDSIFLTTLVETVLPSLLVGGLLIYLYTQKRDANL